MCLCFLLEKYAQQQRQPIQPSAVVVGKLYENRTADVAIAKAMCAIQYTRTSEPNCLPLNECVHYQQQHT